MIPDTLISFKYLREQVRLHAQPQGYGLKGGKWAPAVAKLARDIGAKTVLDYGCGQGQLGDVLRCLPDPLDVYEYDPAIMTKDILPDPADLVVCADVLEHIEPERPEHVLLHLRSLVTTAAFIVVSLDPSNKTLSDKRNAHLILESPEWWQARIEAAGFRVDHDVDALVPKHYTPEKRAKRWIAVAFPC